MHGDLNSALDRAVFVPKEAAMPANKFDIFPSRIECCHRVVAEGHAPRPCNLAVHSALGQGRSHALRSMAQQLGRPGFRVAC
jgi:hypothetical protein